MYMVALWHDGRPTRKVVVRLISPLGLSFLSFQGKVDQAHIKQTVGVLIG